MNIIRKLLVVSAFTYAALNAVAEDPKIIFFTRLKNITIRATNNTIEFTKALGNIPHHVKFAQGCYDHRPSFKLPTSKEKTQNPTALEKAWEQVCIEAEEKCNLHIKTYGFKDYIESRSSLITELEKDNNTINHHYCSTPYLIGMNMMVSLLHPIYQAHHRALTKKAPFYLSHDTKEDYNLTLEHNQKLLDLMSQLTHTLRDAQQKKLKQVKTIRYSAYNPFNDSL